MLDLKKDKYIILELIPTRVKDGDVIQVSALKIDGLKLQSRFDYRLKEENIAIPDFRKLIAYDKEMFLYKETDSEIMAELQLFCEDFPLLIIDNAYTRNYLEKFSNLKEDIFLYFGEKYQDNIIEKLVSKFQIAPTNHIVDILYELILLKF